MQAATSPNTLVCIEPLQADITGSWARDAEYNAFPLTAPLDTPASHSKAVIDAPKESQYRPDLQYNRQSVSVSIFDQSIANKADQRTDLFAKGLYSDRLGGRIATLLVLRLTVVTAACSLAHCRHIYRQSTA